MALTEEQAQAIKNASTLEEKVKLSEQAGISASEISAATRGAGDKYLTQTPVQQGQAPQEAPSNTDVQTSPATLTNPAEAFPTYQDPNVDGYFPTYDYRQDDTKSEQHTVSTYKSIIDMVENGTNPVHTYMANVNRPSRDVQKDITSDDVQRKLQAMRDVLTDDYNNDFTAFQKNAPVAEQAANQVKEEADSPLGAELAYIDSVATNGGKAIPEDLRKRIAVQLKFSRLMLEYKDKHEWGVSDLAGMLLPDVSKDWSDLTGSGWLHSEAGMEKFRNWFMALPPERQATELPVILKAVNDAFDDNPLKVEDAMRTIVTPGGDTFGAIQHYLDKFDVATFVAAAGSAVKAAIPISVAKRVGNRELATAMTESAISDGKVADAVGTTQTKAAASANPMSINPELLDGMPKQSADDLTIQMKSIDDGLKDAEDRALKEGLNLSDEDKAAAIARHKARLEKEPGIENIVPIHQDESGITFSADYVEPSTPYPASAPIFKEIEDTKKAVSDTLAQARAAKGAKKEKLFDEADAMQKHVEDLEDKVTKATVTSRRTTRQYNVKYSLDDVTGGFKADALTGRELVGDVTKGASPNFIFNKDRQSLISTFERLLFASELYRKSFNKALSSSISGLGRGDIADLNKVLMLGAKDEVTYSYKELKAGIDGTRLSNDAIESYYKVRHLMDKAHVLKNKEVRERLEAKGMQSVEYGGESKYVRSYDNFTDAHRSITQSDTRAVYVVDQGKAMTIGADDAALQSLYDRGYKIVKSPDFFKLDKGNYARYIMVKSEEIGPIPHMVIGKREGYIPLQYKDGFYFVKEADKGHILGNSARQTISMKTLRYFDSKLEANAFRDAKAREWLTEKFPGDESKVEEALAKGEHPYSTRHDREMTNEEFDNEIVSIGGGSLYSGHRAQERLLKGMDGTEPEFVPALKATQTYFDHLSVRLPMSQYRLSIEQTWLNHFNKIMAKNGKGYYNGSFIDAIDHIPTSLSPGEKGMLRQAWEQIRYQTRVPTTGEKELESTVRHAAEWMEEKGWFRSAKALNKLDHMDPISALRSATFNTFLGFLRPDQFVVQAFGATVAMSIHPEHFIRSTYKSMALAVLDNVHNDTALGKVLKMFGAKNLDGLGDIEEFYHAWRRTGMYEGVVTGSADYKAMSTSAHVGPEQVHRLMDKGLFFYKSGELTNRRYSFATAYEQWRKLNPGRVLDEAGIKEIVDYSNTLGLHMSRAVKAPWQKGVLSLPTQFYQINAKFIEALTGKELTQADKWKLVMMQGAIFGSMGIPFATTLMDHAAEFVGAKPGDLSADEITALRGGIVDAITHFVIGADVEVSKRGAIGYGIEQAIWDGLSGKSSLVQLAFGASGSWITRAFDAASNVYNIIDSTGWDPSELTTDDYLAGTNGILSSIASWNNASKAWELMHNPVLRNKSGNAVLYSEQLNIQTKWAQGLGFQLSDIEDMYGKSTGTRGAEQTRVAEKTKTIKHLLYTLFKDGEPLDDKQKHRMDVLIKSLLASERPGIQIKIRQQLVKEMQFGDTEYDKKLKAYVTRAVEGTYTTEDIMNRMGDVLHGEKK